MIDERMIAATEAVLFAAAEPLDYTRIASVLGIEPDLMTEVLEALKDKLSTPDSGICLLQLDTKYQLCSRKEFVEEIRSVLDLKRNTPLSQAAFEVLAIVAYNQPITKPYIEQIRGVDCSGVVNTLCQRGLIEEKGRLDVPGRPVLYGTTPDFLRCFSLSALSDLPELPTGDRDVLMSDVEGKGQMSMFDTAEESVDEPTEESAEKISEEIPEAYADSESEEIPEAVNLTAENSEV